MLQTNPDQRLNITEIFSSNWFQQKASNLNINLNDRNKLKLVGFEESPLINQDKFKDQADLNVSNAHDEPNKNYINEKQDKNIRNNCNIPTNNSLEIKKEMHETLEALLNAS